MHRSAFFAGALSLMAGAMLLASPACSEGIAGRSCGEIPSGGCPAETGGTCKDRNCAAVYSCVAEVWRLEHSCPVGGGGMGSGGDAVAGNGGAGGCQPVVLDKTGESQGCEPELQLPDCAAGATEVCQPCDTGCSEFFLCTADGWKGAAFCDDDGQLIVEP